MLTESPTVYECLAILKHPLLHKSLFVLETCPFSTALSCTVIIITTTNDVYNDNNNCEMPKIHSSQMPISPQLVPVDMEKQIKIPDSKVMIVS